MTINFKTAFEYLPDCQILLNRDYAILAASNAYLAITESTREKILGKYIFDSFPENSDIQESTRRILAGLDGVKNTGQPFIIESIRYDLRDVETGTFSQRYWTVSGTGIPDDDKPDLILYRATDITRETLDQQRMEEKLKAVDIQAAC